MQLWSRNPGWGREGMKKRCPYSETEVRWGSLIAVTATCMGAGARQCW